MGYSVYNHMVYGVVLQIGQLFKKSRVRSCGHQVDATSKYCPECGKPMYKEEEVPLIRSFEKKSLSYYYTHSGSNENKEEYCVLGFDVGVKCGGSPDILTLPPFDDKALEWMRQEILDFANKNGISVNFADISFHAVMHHSY